MKLTKEERKWSHRLYRDSFTDDQLDVQKVRGIVQALVEKRPRGMKGILKNYYHLIKVEESKKLAVIESATPLQGELSEKIVNQIKGKYGDHMKIEIKTNPELIAGVKIRIGDNVFDGSILNRLNVLKKQF